MVNTKAGSRWEQLRSQFQNTPTNTSKALQLARCLFNPCATVLAFFIIYIFMSWYLSSVGGEVPPTVSQKMFREELTHYFWWFHPDGRLLIFSQRFTFCCSSFPCVLSSFFPHPFPLCLLLLLLHAVESSALNVHLLTLMWLAAWRVADCDTCQQLWSNTKTKKLWIVPIHDPRQFVKWRWGGPCSIFCFLFCFVFVFFSMETTAWAPR